MVPGHGGTFFALSNVFLRTRVPPSLSLAASSRFSSLSGPHSPLHWIIITCLDLRSGRYLASIDLAVPIINVSRLRFLC